MSPGTGNRLQICVMLALWGCVVAAHAAEAAKPRVVVMTDIDPGYGDPDDRMSMVRLLLYSNELDIEGLIATKNKPKHSLHPELIRERVEAYGTVRSRLAEHASGWPAKDDLLACVKAGQNGVDMNAVGDGKDTEGSNLIISVVDRKDPRPVWLISWDGLSTPAQALWDVMKRRSKEEVSRFTSRIRIYTITEDADCGPWIRRTFPDIHYVWADRHKTYEGMSEGGDLSSIDDAWRKRNIVDLHGPLGRLYPPRAPWFVEADTPSFLFLMTFNGLCAPMHPDYGGWGGRYRNVNTWWYDTEKGDTGIGEEHPRNTVWRWRHAFQNDFAARMDWCVTSHGDANHPPVAAFDGRTGVAPVRLEAKPGAVVPLSSAGSSDPDDDRLSYRWYVYPEAGTYGKVVSVEDNTSRRARMTVPDDAGEKTIHVILEVTDDGAPSLTRYRRIIVDVADDAGR